MTTLVVFLVALEVSIGAEDVGSTALLASHPRLAKEKPTIKRSGMERGIWGFLRGVGCEPAMADVGQRYLGQPRRTPSGEVAQPGQYLASNEIALPN